MTVLSACNAGGALVATGGHQHQHDARAGNAVRAGDPYEEDGAVKLMRPCRTPKRPRGMPAENLRLANLYGAVRRRDDAAVPPKQNTSTANADTPSGADWRGIGGPFKLRQAVQLK